MDAFVFVDGSDTPDAHAGEFQLDQGLFDRVLPPATPITDRRFEGHLAQLRHPKGHLVGLRLQLPLVMARPGRNPHVVALVPLCLAKTIGLGIR